MSIKGKIIVNPFGVPGQSAKQAQRLKDEFEKLGVEVEILTHAYLRVQIGNEQILSDLEKSDFIIFLDKDKYLSAILERLGIKLFNTHSAIRVCDDKGETYIALAGKGFNLPKTQFAPVCYSSSCQIIKEQIESLEKSIGYPMIVKQSYGSCGSGIYKVNDRKELLPVMEKLKTTPHMFQEYLGREVGKDIRVIVIGGKAIAAMIRSNQNDFRSTIALGGSGTPVDVEDKTYSAVIDTAERAAKTLGLDYCGVDILKGNNGEPVICEVNSNAFFEGIESVTNINVARTYAKYIIGELTK